MRRRRAHRAYHGRRHYHRRKGLKHPHKGYHGHRAYHGRKTKHGRKVVKHVGHARKTHPHKLVRQVEHPLRRRRLKVMQFLRNRRPKLARFTHFPHRRKA